MQADYLQWAEANNFVSMLPKDTKQRRVQASANSQSQLDSHVQPMVPKERTIPYSDKAFRHAAIQWLIGTDQVTMKYYPVDVMFFDASNCSLFHASSTHCLRI